MHLLLRPRTPLVAMTLTVTLVVYVVLGAALLYAAGDSPLWGAGLGAAGAVGPVIGAARRMLRRALVVYDEGLQVQRDEYRVTFAWQDAVEVRTRRLGVVPLDEIVFRTGAADPVDSRGRRRKAVPAKVARKGADSRVMVGFYDPDWRDGPVGRRLAAHGLALGGT